jgi:drug/metabolite transporter (DMT)-like permease
MTVANTATRNAFSKGASLILGSAVIWSFGGTIQRFISVSDSWTIVFWRSAFAAAFLLLFMIWRDGPTGTIRLIKNMRWPSFIVSAGFFTASISFVVALAYTSVANILLIQASVPLLAALMAWIIFKEHVALMTWLAIIAVIIGVAIMVFESLGGEQSFIGTGLALLIAICFSVATVTTRRHSEVRMTPAVFVAVFAATLVAIPLSGQFAVSAVDLGWLFAFGALNLGLGLALFTTGARMIPAAVAALIGTAEPVLGPFWAWLIHGENPGLYTLVGGSIVLAALLMQIGYDLLMQERT